MNHVAFLGPSGVGKTTVRKRVGAQLPGTIHGRDGRNECLSRSLAFGRFVRERPSPLAAWLFERYWRYHARERYLRGSLVAHPRTGEAIAELLQTIDEGKGPSRHVDPHSLNDHVLEELARYHLLSENTEASEPVLIDDGLYQFFLFLLLGESSWTPERLVRSLPKPDVLITVEAPPDVCFERQESRSRGRIGPFRELDEGAILAVLERMSAASERLSAASRRSGTRTIHVTNADDPDATVDTIVQRLRSFETPS